MALISGRMGLRIASCRLSGPMYTVEALNEESSALNFKHSLMRKQRIICVRTSAIYNQPTFIQDTQRPRIPQATGKRGSFSPQFFALLLFRFRSPLHGSLPFQGGIAFHGSFALHVFPSRKRLLSRNLLPSWQWQNFLKFKSKKWQTL